MSQSLASARSRMALELRIDAELNEHTPQPSHVLKLPPAHPLLPLVPPDLPLPLASQSLASARSRMALELKMDAELNDEEVARVTAAAAQEVTDEQGKLEVLLAKHTLQAGLYHKTLQVREVKS